MLERSRVYCEQRARRSPSPRSQQIPGAPPARTAELNRSFVRVLGSLRAALSHVAPCRLLGDGEHREEHRARRHAVTLFFLEHGCDLGPSQSGSWPPQHRNEARIAGITLSWGGCGVLGGNAGLPLRFQLWLL